MVEEKVIQESYEAMSDEGLIHFAQTEARTLTPVASIILQREFEKRQLDFDLTSTNGSLKISSSIVDPDNGKRYDNAIKYALQLKQEGLGDENVVLILLESGMKEAAARQILEQVKPEAKARLLKASRGLLFSIFVIMAGVALKLINPYRPFVGIIDIIAAIGIGFGFIQFIACIYTRDKYQTILKNLA